MLSSRTSRCALAGAPCAARDAAALGDAQRDVVEHRQVAEQRVDLERAAEAALHPRRLASVA